MKILKQVFESIEFHLNAKERTFTILYGESQITISLTEEGKLKLDTSLLLEAPAKKNDKEVLE